MKQISKEQLAMLRKEFPIGCRVELLSMSDVFAPPIGTKGTVQYIDDLGDGQAPPIGTKGRCLGVDDIGSIMVAWQNGCGLSVAFGEDLCRVVKDDEEAID